MGLLLGRPDPATPHTLIVTDAFPLPIEGFETRVIADDVEVINHMIALGESLEQTRREKFMGWYHSHPFDLSENSHCFLSQTDISTQLQWQRAEDPHGNPFLAIVIDPLRSLAQNYPELKAFRAYPPEYTNPIPNECPDGTVIQEEQARLEKWGSCATSYYELRVECYMSRGARNVLGLLNRKSLWMKGLVAGQKQSQQQQKKKGGQMEQVDGVAKVIGRYDPMKLKKGSASASGAGAGAGAGSLLDERLSSIQPPSSSMAAAAATTAGSGTEKLTNEETEEEKDELGKACQELVEITTEQLVGNIAQMSKKELFSSLV